jgi:Flp pilus assembly protein TadD/SAM-dependent methyltransferase
MNRKQRSAGRAHGRGSPGRSGSTGSAPSADQLFQLGLAHHGAGRLAEAENLFRSALQIDPKHSDCLNSLGILAHQCGHPQAAITFISQAIAVDGRVAQYHYNLGLVFAGLGRIDEAVAHNRRAVSLDPDNADAHTNLGGALAAQGGWDEAALHFRQALARRPDVPFAYQNLANALLAQGMHDEGLQVITRGLAVEETDTLKQNFAREVIKLQSAPEIPGFITLLQRAALEGWSRPEDFSVLFTTLLKQDELVAACLERAACSQKRPTPGGPFGPGDIAALGNNKLLQCMMVSAPICDGALELLLTSVRRTLLDLAGSREAPERSEDVLSFCCTLARQCFINEYIFHCSEEEQEQACALRDRLTALMNTDDTVPALMIGCVATYFPLHTLAVSPCRFAKSWPDAVARIVVQQVDEPATERSLRTAIPTLSPIGDGVSSQVREMYEENPYPRWVTTLALNSDLTFDEKMRLMFRHASFDGLGKTEVDMLIAGCGTGRHAIDNARLFRGVKILAIDLSLASLAYARRKADEAGLPDIEFGQADILELGGLGRTFDVIESVGVLHHLHDPLQGWRVLLGLLRPGGFMKIGLYSAAARQGISAARAPCRARLHRRRHSPVPPTSFSRWRGCCGEIDFRASGFLHGQQLPRLIVSRPGASHDHSGDQSIPRRQRPWIYRLRRPRERPIRGALSHRPGDGRPRPLAPVRVGAADRFPGYVSVVGAEKSRVAAPCFARLAGRCVRHARRPTPAGTDARCTLRNPACRLAGSDRVPG